MKFLTKVVTFENFLTKNVWIIFGKTYQSEQRSESQLEQKLQKETAPAKHRLSATYVVGASHPATDIQEVTSYMTQSELIGITFFKTIILISANLCLELG